MSTLILIHRRLFLDLREAAHRSHRAYGNPSEVTHWTVGQWAATRSGITFASNEEGYISTAGLNSVRQPSIWPRGMTGYEDFAVEPRYFDDDSDSDELNSPN